MKEKALNFLKKIDWINTAFLLLTPVLALGGTATLVWMGRLHWATVIFAVFMAALTGLAITGGYHRLFAHRTYQAKPLYKLLMLIFGAAAFENSALRWASDHRYHHKYVDTDLDPYNIKRGFWFAHMGWVMLKYKAGRKYDNVADLEADSLVMFQQKHYVKMGILVGFVMPTVVASLWGDALGGFFIAGLLRTVMNHHFTFSINSFAHLIGKRPYSDQNTSRDSWFLAFLTYGEGYHNFHHKFPTDFRNGIHSYHWDPTKWLIKGLERTGLTYNLRQVPSATILRAKLRMDEKRILRRIQAHPQRFFQMREEFVASTRLKIDHAYQRFTLLKMEYECLKKEKMAHLSSRIDQLRKDLHEAHEHLVVAFAEWKELCGTFGVPYTRVVFSY